VKPAIKWNSFPLIYPITKDHPFGEVIGARPCVFQEQGNSESPVTWFLVGSLRATTGPLYHNTFRSEHCKETTECDNFSGHIIQPTRFLYISSSLKLISSDYNTFLHVFDYIFINAYSLILANGNYLRIYWIYWRKSSERYQLFS
jgi:hypothetical protein